MALNDKQKRFCDEYLLCWNKTEAAIKAGYARSTADKQAQLWIGKNRDSSKYPEMWDYVEARRQKLSSKYEITQDKVAAELAKLLFTDVRDLYDENGNLLPIHLMGDGAAAIIAGFEVEETIRDTGKKTTTKTATKKVKISKKAEAIQIAARMFGFNAADKVELTGSFLDFLKKAKQAKP